MRLITFIAFLIFCNSANSIELPARCLKLKKTLTSYAHQSFGLNAPIALLAAQIYQESRCKPNAASKYAKGLTQFTPATWSDMKRWYPSYLKKCSIWNANCSLRAMVLYNRRLYKAIKETADNCNHWAMTLSAYNGGLVWVNRDRRLAKKHGRNPTLWFRHTERHTKRANWAKKENRHYVKVILGKHQKLHLRSGYFSPQICTGEML